MFGLRIFFSFILFDLYSYFIFFYSRLDSCFDSVFQIILFNYFDSIKVRHLILDFIFQTLHRFGLFQHCIFYALTLQLFISSACYKQTSMLMVVCFMLVLAILRLSDVFSSVLGVVYRLGLK